MRFIATHFVGIRGEFWHFGVYISNVQHLSFCLQYVDKSSYNNATRPTFNFDKKLSGIHTAYFIVEDFNSVKKKIFLLLKRYSILIFVNFIPVLACQLSFRFILLPPFPFPKKADPQNFKQAIFLNKWVVFYGKPCI